MTSSTTLETLSAEKLKDFILDMHRAGAVRVSVHGVEVTFGAPAVVSLPEDPDLSADELEHLDKKRRDKILFHSA